MKKVVRIVAVVLLVGVVVSLFSSGVLGSLTSSGGGGGGGGATAGSTGGAVADATTSKNSGSVSQTTSNKTPIGTVNSDKILYVAQPSKIVGYTDTVADTLDESERYDLTPDFGEVSYLNVATLQNFQDASTATAEAATVSDVTVTASGSQVQTFSLSPLNSLPDPTYEDYADTTVALYCTIDSEADFLALSAYCQAGGRTKNVNFVQTRDLDFDGMIIDSIGNEPGKAFYGNYYGCGFKIQNVTLYQDHNHGLFGSVSGSLIDGLIVDNVYSEVWRRQAVLAYRATNTTFSRCVLENIIFLPQEGNALSSDSIAGFVCVAQSSVTFDHCMMLSGLLCCPAFVSKFGATTANKVSFYGCVNKADIIDAKEPAGFVGQHNGKTNLSFNLCTNYGDVRGEEFASGGFLTMSENLSGSVEFNSCINYGYVGSAALAGGFVGRNAAKTMTLNGCINYGIVSGCEAAGGMIGELYLDGAIFTYEMCISAGAVYTAEGDACGSFFGLVDIYAGNESFVEIWDARSLYNFSAPVADFIGLLFVDGEMMDDDLRHTLSDNRVVFHDLKIPPDYTVLSESEDETDLFLFALLDGEGLSDQYVLWSGEMLYFINQVVDGQYIACAHKEAIYE